MVIFETQLPRLGKTANERRYGTGFPDLRSRTVLNDFAVLNLFQRALLRREEQLLLRFLRRAFARQRVFCGRQANQGLERPSRGLQEFRLNPN